MLKVHINNRQRTMLISRRMLVQLLRLAAPERWKHAEISVVIVESDEMARLNLRYTGRRGETDVLAFPLHNPEHPGESLVGEIIVSASQAQKEAVSRSVASEHELALYLVHGVLHLLTYDDHCPADRREMYAREAQLLKKANIPYVRRSTRRVAVKHKEKREVGKA